MDMFVLSRTHRRSIRSVHRWTHQDRGSPINSIEYQGRAAWLNHFFRTRFKHIHGKSSLDSLRMEGVLARTLALHNKPGVATRPMLRDC